MPKIGEIKRGWVIGIKTNTKCIWHACEVCGKERWVQLVKEKPAHKLCIPCSSSSLRYRTILSETRSGNKNPRWRGGHTYITGGYIRIWLPPNHFFYPMVRKNHCVLEHRLVMAEHLGRCLQSFEIVHHKNGIRDDNRIENLELTMKGSHSIQHGKGYCDGYQKGFIDGQSSQIKELRKELKLIQWQNKMLFEELRKYKIEL